MYCCGITYEWCCFNKHLFLSNKIPKQISYCNTKCTVNGLISRLLCLSICPQAQVLLLNLHCSNQKRSRKALWHPLRPHSIHPQTRLRSALLSSPHKPPLSFLIYLQTVRLWKGAAWPPVQPHTLTRRAAPREVRRRRWWRGKRLRRPRATKKLLTVLRAKWRLTPALSWRLTVVVCSTILLISFS